ncbi:hypothetical protein [Jiangella asiatica]
MIYRIDENARTIHVLDVDHRRRPPVEPLRSLDHAEVGAVNA